MGELVVLYEHASGVALMKVNGFEDVGSLLPQVEASVTDLKRFNQIVKLITFSPFKTTVDALHNMNSISEGLLPDSLKDLLEYNVTSHKGGKVTVGVQDSKLAAAVSETLGLPTLTSGPVPEIMRGIRLHFPSLVKGAGSPVAQLALGHSYSRAKVKFNIHRVDNMIIQSIALLDQMDKDINTFSMRIREWYSYHFPELYKIVPENFTYARLASHIGNRKRLSEDDLPGLEEITLDPAKAMAILKASRSSMGMDIADIDLANIETFGKRIVALSEYRGRLVTYLRSKMESIAPNLAALIGDSVGARLISHAGSLTNLAKYPASTVQVLGAEKALFRALKVRGKTPKYGLLYHSTFIAKADGKNKGRISRFLANKCSIASRIDCFAEVGNSVYGEKLREQVEERLKFYTSGETPRRNAEVMALAHQAAIKFQSEAPVVNGLDKSHKKKKKKKKETQGSEDVEENGANESWADATLESGKKKKKKRKESFQSAEEEQQGAEENGMNKSWAEATTTPESGKKKKKKRKESFQSGEEQTMEISFQNAAEDEEGPPSKKKKKKKSLPSGED